MNFRRLKMTVFSVLLAATSASATGKNQIKIKVLDSETHSVIIDDSGVPKNCDQVNFDAYCHNSKTTQVTNTMLVQEGNQPVFRISCAIDSKWSRCIPLGKGETFDARRQKKGLLVYYVDDRGKVRSQFYSLVASNVPVMAAVQPLISVQSPKQGASSAPANTSTPALTPSTHDSEPAATNSKCNFTSTPSGAEITLDGKYVGSTPSEIGVSTGAHVVAFSLPGFAQWKRDLTVIAGSELTISATLQKQ